MQIPVGTQIENMGSITMRPASLLAEEKVESMSFVIKQQKETTCTPTKAKLHTLW
jgi:hypothetical protein